MITYDNLYQIVHKDENMCIKNRICALVFRCIMLLTCGFGLSVFLGLQTGQIKWSALIYYTNLSNLVCFLFYTILTVKTIVELKNDGAKGTTTLLPHFKGAFVMMITVTFLIYHFMLGSGFSMTEDRGVSFNIANNMLHYVTPIMVILDWLLFDKKKTYRWFDPLLWLIIPYIYFAFALIRAEIGGVITGRDSRYPYFFIDVDALGWSGVATYVAVITIAFTALGYLLFLIDKVQFKRKS